MDWTKVGIWIRTDSDRDKLSYVASVNDCEVVREYEAQDVGSLFDSSVWKQVVSDVHDKTIECLIVERMPKLSTKLNVLVDAVKFFDEHNARIYFVGDSLSTSSPVGKLMFQMVRTFAEFERKEIQNRFASERS